MSNFKLNKRYITLSSETRLNGLSIPIIGLTGGIASGKSSSSNYLMEKGFTVIDADKLIHKIYTENETIKFIRSINQSFIYNGKVDFKKLREYFFGNKEAKVQIESFLYQRLPNAFNQALSSSAPSNIIFYDAPLLFEKKINTKVDISLTIFCNEEIQSKRLIERDSITSKLAQEIISSQISLSIKKERSDFVINNNSTIKRLHEEIDSFIAQIAE